MTGLHVCILLTIAFAILDIEGSRYTSNFEQIAKSRYFVDKTDILKAFTDGNFHFLSCPPGFGKSTNSDMARRFFQITFDNNTGTEIDPTITPSYKLFTNTSLNLKIAQDQNFIDEHFGRYVVLYIDFANVCGSTTNEIIHSMKETIFQTITPYRWLYDKLKQKDVCDNNTLKFWDDAFNASIQDFNFVRAYKYVAGSIAQHFDKKLMIIIVNYDFPYQLSADKLIWNINDFFRSLIFSFMFTRKEPVDKGNVKVIVTGVFRSFMQAALEKRLSRISFASFLSYEYGIKYPFYFTTDEVDRLFDVNKLQPVEREKVKKFYGGYVWKEDVQNRWHSEERTFISEEIIGSSLYNPSGVVRYLETKTFESADNSTENIMIPQVMKCLRYPTMFNEIMTLLTKRTTRFLLPKRLSHKINILDYIHNMAAKDCAKSVLYRFETWFGGHPHLIPMLDSGYLTHNDKSFAIANTASRKNLNRELKRFVTYMYGINITHTEVTDYLQNITADNVTSTHTLDKLLVVLQSITKQMVPFRDSRLSKFRCVMLATLYYNWDSYDDMIKIASISDPNQEMPAHNGWIPIPNISTGILLNVELEVNKDEDDPVCENFRRYIPLDPPDVSPIKVVKYLCIFADIRNRIHIKQGENRITW